MRKLALLLALSTGCALYLPGQTEDDTCGPGGVLISASQLRDPSTGTCESFPNGVPCGCNQICAPAAFPDWSICSGACDTLDETACLNAPGCRTAYTAPEPTPGVPHPPTFRACWETAPSGPIEGGDCTTLDAQACSRHDDCAAIYVDALDNLNRVTSTTFAQCIPEPAHPTCGTMTCGPDEHCQDPCPACDGIPVCVPNGACEALATEAACKLRADCLPLYQGTDCTCTPTTCTCAVETYERCETAPAP
jgi:hypothetical protein